MAIDDAAGRRAVRERRRTPEINGESVFTQLPSNSPRSRMSVVILRDDVHQRGLTAARKALRAAHKKTRGAASQ